jgi:hypothetical protein
MTHLEWVLLRPAEQWPRPNQRERIMARDDLMHVLSRDGWDLLRVRLTPGHRAWFESLARGAAAGETLLGTPLAPLSAPKGALSIKLEPERVTPGEWFLVYAEMVNAGTETWPALLAPGDASPFPVKITLRVASDISGNAPAVIDAMTPLWRDVPAGESFLMAVPLVAPKTPGRYELEVGLWQQDAPGFDLSSSKQRTATLVVADQRGGRAPEG